MVEIAGLQLLHSVSVPILAKTALKASASFKNTGGPFWMRAKDILDYAKNYFWNLHRKKKYDNVLTTLKMTKNCQNFIGNCVL